MAKRLNQSAADSRAALCPVVAGLTGRGDEPQSIFADNTPPPPDPPPSVQEGVFRDGIVSGLGFVSGAESGITDADGRFTCEAGREVAFSIGAVAIGSADCATLVMLPSLSSSGSFDDPVTINVARFDSPDRISGRWSRPAFNASGTLQLTRLPSGGGDYRFVGLAVSFRREGMIVLDLDGNDVTGTAIDVLGGQIFTVTGTLDGDQMTLVPFDGGNERSASGTVLFDAEGVPLGVSGEWLNGGRFQAAACRLN